MEKVNLDEKLGLITEHWRPKVVGELNGQEVKLVKFKRTFVWHHHDHEDELFLGVRGRFRVEFSDRTVEVGPGELIIVPRGVKHRTVADRRKIADNPPRRYSMLRATWNGAVIAESDHCEVVEGNQYFPPDAINRSYFRESVTHTVCPWKGTASYYDVVVNGQTNKDAAWYYPTPKDAAKQINGYVAFWHGVKVEV